MKQTFQTILTTISLILVLGSAHAAMLEFTSITYQPAPAEPGKLTTIYATIKNTGNQNSGPVTVTLKPEYPFSLSPAGRSEKTFDTILGLQSVLAILELQVDSGALNGTYSLDAQIKEDQQNAIGTPFSIQVLSIKPQIEIIQSEARSAEPGQVFTNRITIRNVGSSTARNIFIGTSGAETDQPIRNVGVGFVFIESLEPNQSTTLDIALSADSSAEQKTYSIPITVKYQDTNRSEYEETRYLGIRLIGTAEMDGDLSIDPQLRPYPGSQNEITVNLYNRGTATARNIVVEIIDTQSWENQGDKKVFIGTLDPDDFDSFSLNIKVKPDVAPGTYPVVLRFAYKNQDNESKTIDRNLSIQILSQGDAQTNSTNGGNNWNLILLVIVIVVIGYWWYRRQNSDKKLATKK